MSADLWPLDPAAPPPRQTTPTDVELMAVAACRHRYRAAEPNGCWCERYSNFHVRCMALELYGTTAQAQLAALRAHHRLISSPEQARP